MYESPPYIFTILLQENLNVWLYQFNKFIWWRPHVAGFNFFNIDNLHISIPQSIHPIICWLLNVKFFNVDNPHVYWFPPIYIHNVVARKSYISLTNLYDEYLILLVVKFFNVDSLINHESSIYIHNVVARKS